MKDVHPMHIAWIAMRQNFLPALLLQAAMFLLLAAYFFHAPTRERLDVVSMWKSEYGYFFSFLLTGFAAGVLPEILRILFFQKGKIRRENMVNILFCFVFWGCIGVFLDFFYRCQGVWFGTGNDFRTLAIKTFVDMAIFTALITCPLGTILYRWRDSGFDPRFFRIVFTLDFLKAVIIPTVVACWAVWIPIVLVIYSMPPTLQIFVCVIAETFWVMLLITMSELHRQREEAVALAAANKSSVI